MNTLLPYADFYLSAKVLTNEQCWQQCLEAVELIDLLDNPEKESTLRNHPALLMWTGYSDALKNYFNHILEENLRRGVKTDYKYFNVGDNFELPWWFGNGFLHASHRSNLLKMSKSHYSKYNWTESDNIEFWWPKGKTINS